MTSKLFLKENPTLKDFQNYVKKLKKKEIFLLTIRF